MKKLFLSGILMLFATGAFAQTSQGNISLGGSLQFSNSTSNYDNSENKLTGLTVSPSVGYFVRDGLELGVSTRFGFSSGSSKQNNSDNENKSNTIQLGIGTYLTKYLPITDKLHFTATGALGYNNSKTKRPEEEQKLYYTTSGIYVSAAPGLTYFATQKLGLSVSIGYVGYNRSTQTYHQAEPKQESISEGFDFTFSPSSASVGIRYFINR